MADPKLREQMDRERTREDEITRRTAPHAGPPTAPRHIRGMYIGGRMYGEDDSVIGYFVGHMARGIKALGRLIFRRAQRDESDDSGPIQYKDYDPD